MTEQQKLFRLLKMITILKRPLGRTIKGLSEELEVCPRTIYRYLDLLQMVGFDIETSISGNRKFIPVFDDNQNDLNFTTDESILLRDLVLSGTTNKVLKTSILQKLYINSELEPIAENLIDGRINLLKSKLLKAMNQEKQVWLKSYHSISSGEIKDYKVEPFHLTENYSSVMAFDVNAGIVKQFKLSRMSDVLILDKEQEYIDQHTVKKTDVFNFTGDKTWQVKLKLSFQAYLILREEYPKSIPFLVNQENEEYYFIGQVFNLCGVGRFVLSMLDEVIIIDPPELKDYVAGKLQEYLSLNEDRKLTVKEHIYKPETVNEKVVVE